MGKLLEKQTNSYGHPFLILNILKENVPKSSSDGDHIKNIAIEQSQNTNTLCNKLIFQW